MEKQPITLVGNAHIDPVWLWKRCEGLSEVKSTFRSALDRMREFPDYIFTCACASYYRWIEAVDPGMFDEIRGRVAEGRWSVAGGMWVQPDCNLPSGEAFARHFLYSQRYFTEKFGAAATVGYNVDSFGHNGMLPQLLRQAGLDSYVFTRPGAEEKPGLPHLFLWESPDGSRVTAFRTVFGYNHSLNGCPDDGQAPCLAKLEVIRRTAQEQGLPFQHYYGVGNHGGGPSVRELTLLSEACAQDDSVRFGSPRQYFDAVEAAGLTGRLPVVKGDLQHHASGCYSAHAGIKAANRRAENALGAAETYDLLASVLLAVPPQTAALRAAWERLLFSQSHDTLAGCCVREACDEALGTFAAACDAAGEVASLATQRLSWNIRTTDILDRPPAQKNGWKLWEKEGQGAPYVVFNPHSFPVRIPLPLNLANTGVTDEQGRPVPVQAVRGPQTNGWDHYNMLFQAELPPLGYRTYYLYQDHRFEDTAPSPVKAGETFLENEALRAEFDPASGAMTRLLDKESGRELTAGPAARVLVMDDGASDTWAHGVFTFDREIGVFGGASLRVLETGPVRAALRVTVRYGASSLTQDFSLSAGRRALDVRCRLNWQEPLKIAKLSVPVRAELPRAVYSLPCGFLTKEADGAEEPSHEWAGVYGPDGRGLALLNDGKYSVCAKGNDLRLTLARSAVYADHFGERDDLVEYMDLGEQIFHYALMPHFQDDPAETVKTAALLNRMPEALMETHHAGALPPVYTGVRLNADNVLLAAWKAAEDGNGVILRLVEIAGKTAACRVELPALKRDFTVSLRPQELLTLRLPADGGAPERLLLTEYPPTSSSVRP
ncbi:MAG TPA: alpha-mannosidase [Firmicutes bacterium]|nr:alpha-mannosidase [Bacillota bacterium]